MKPITLLAFVVTCLIALNATTVLAESKEIRIAANLPLSGDLGEYGTAIQQGALLASLVLEERSHSGRTFTFDWQDNRGNNRDAYTIMSSQLANSPDVYISGLKPQTMTITEQVSKTGVPHFTWILDVKINPNSSNNLRAWVNFKLEAEAYLRAIKGQSFERVAMLYVNLPAAELQFNKILSPALKKQGAKDIWIEPYPADTTDFKSLSLRVKSYNPDLIILNGFIPHLVSLVRDLRRLHLIKEGNTLVSLDMLEAAAHLSINELEGIIVAAPQYLTSPLEDDRLHWRGRFEKEFGGSPSYHAAFAYDMILAIDAAAKKLPPKPSPSDWLASLRSISVKGITGDVVFDEDGSSKTAMNPCVYRNGTLEPLK